MAKALSPKSIAASLDELWSPRVVAELEDSYVKVAKVRGQLAWHSHDGEDEMFFILKGRLRIEMEERGDGQDALDRGAAPPAAIKKAEGLCPLGFDCSLAASRRRGE